MSQGRRLFSLLVYLQLPFLVVQAQSMTNQKQGPEPGLSGGEVAGIVISLLFVLACVLGGLITGLLLLWKYQPWSNNNKIVETRIQNEALNNPIYGNPESNGVNNSTDITLNITSDGAADLRDRTLKKPAGKVIDQSDPLYSSKEDVTEDNTDNMERSVFVENQFLVNVLQPIPGDVPPTGTPNVKPSEDGSCNRQDPLHASTIDPYASYKDGLPPELEPTGQQQQRLQFDDTA